ncbi:MAG: FAD-dependent oxidoreductase [Patescibacteria group bacterium]|nr:FAD-dependent oxidoreductase [Patescibacteria group bacterium]
MKKKFDLIIIGGGPAGITAGIYGARENLDMLLITKNFGGQIKRKAIDIENYPGFEKISGKDLVEKFENHLKKFEIPVLMEEVIKIKRKKQFFSVLTKQKKEFQAVSVIIASGTRHRRLKINGEEKFIGKGVSYCAVCDGFLYKNKVVAIIGGGNSAFETALFLSKIAKKVYILERGAKVIADKINQKLAKKAKNIKVCANVILREIKGKSFVEAIEYEDIKTKKIKILKNDGVFIEAGNMPNSDFFRDLVDYNERKEIKINAETGETSVKGLFSAGDVSDIEFKQIVIAASAGAKAELNASKYIQKQKRL